MPSVISTKRAVSGSIYRMIFRRQPPWVIIIKNGWSPGFSSESIKKFGGCCVKKNGRNEEPSAGIIDSQSVKGTAESAEESGFDSGKKVKGRKHHIVVDTIGCVLVALVHAANIHDSKGAQPVLERVFEAVPTLRRIWADQGYKGRLVEWVKKTFSCELEVVSRKGKKFKVLPRRWVVERTFAWLSRYRRLVREYEKKPASSVAMIYVASIRIMLKKVLRRFLWSQPCRTPDLKPTNWL